MLSYPFAWLPVVTVVGALVLLNAWLILIGLAIVAFVALALVVALVWAAAAEVYALMSRRRPASRSRAGGSDVDELAYEASTVRSASSRWTVRR